MQGVRVDFEGFFFFGCVRNENQVFLPSREVFEVL